MLKFQVKTLTLFFVNKFASNVKMSYICSIKLINLKQSVMTSQQTIVKEVVKVIFKTIKGTSFVGIRNYTSKSRVKKEGDIAPVSHQTFLVGVNRGKRLEQDLEALQNFDLAPVIEKYGKTVAEKAHVELIIALQKVLAPENVKVVLRAQNDATINRSDAQKDAYIWLNPCLKMHKETGDIYVDGYCVRRTEVVKGKFTPTKSQDKTLAKEMIKKLADVKDRHYRCFKVGNKATLKLQGITLPW